MAVKEVVADENKNEGKEVVVELDKNDNVIKPEKKEEPKYVTAEILQQELEKAIKKATAPIAYELRKRNEATPAAPPASAPIQEKQEPDEWDKKLQTNWKGTVEELAELRFKKLMEEESSRRQAEFQKQQSLQLLERNKIQVLEKHKELNDETSSKAEIYRNVLQEHPEYLSNPFGPVLAMRDMEDKLRENGIVDEPTKKIVQKEVLRQARAGAGTLPKGAPAGTNQKIILTKDQKDFCDQQGIKYENYARFAKMGQTAEAAS